MAASAPNRPIPHFNLAHTAYAASTLFRRNAVTEDEVDASEDLIEPMFDAMLAAPARTPRQIAEKARAILDECEISVEPYMVEALYRDLVALAEAVQ